MKLALFDYNGRLIVCVDSANVLPDFHIALTKLIGANRLRQQLAVRQFDVRPARYSALAFIEFLITGVRCRHHSAVSKNTNVANTICYRTEVLFSTCDFRASRS